MVHDTMKYMKNLKTRLIAPEKVQDGWNTVKYFTQISMWQSTFLVKLEKPQNDHFDASTLVSSSRIRKCAKIA